MSMKVFQQELDRFDGCVFNNFEIVETIDLITFIGECIAWNLICIAFYIR